MNRDEKGESKRGPAAARGRRRQGRQQRTGGEKAAQAKEVGACSSNGVQREVADHPRANTSVQTRKAPEQHPQHGVEGRAQHRAEAFVAMRKIEDRSLAVTTLHTTGMTTGPSQDTTRYPEGGTSRKLTGPEGPKGPTEGAGRTRGGTQPGGNEPIRSNPKQHKKNAQNNRGRHKQHPPKAKTHPQHHRTLTGKHTNQTTTDAPGQTEQAAKQSRPIDTGPNTLPGIGKRKRSTLKGQKANQTTAKKGGQKSNEKGAK